MTRACISGLVAAAAACASPVTPAACATDGDCTGGFCVAGLCRPGTRDCPRLEPRFSSISENLFQVGCGVTSRGSTSSTNCHGAELATGGSNLDLSPAHAWANLVGIRACDAAAALDAGASADLSVCSDAGTGSVMRRDDCGVPAGPAELARVRPGDASRSFLFIKLRMTASTGPCGSGMPPDHPGLYSCADTLSAVEQWIARGAPND